MCMLSVCYRVRALAAGTAWAHFIVTITPPLTEVLGDAILMMQALNGVGYLHIGISCIDSNGYDRRVHRKLRRNAGSYLPAFFFCGETGSNNPSVSARQ